MSETTAAPAAPAEGAAPAPAAEHGFVSAATTLINTPAEPAAEPAKPAEGEVAPAPETPPIFSLTDVKLPEGVEIPEEVGKEFSEILNSKAAPAEVGQKLLDLYAKQAAELVDSNAKLWAKTNEQWQNEIKADPVIGGDKLPSTLANIAKLLDNPEFTDPGLRAALDLTGAGNNPAIVRFLAKAASRLSEGGYVPGAPPASAPARPQTLGEAFYGTQAKD